MNALKDLIQDCGHTYKTLAKELGITHLTVYQWVIGYTKPSDKNIEKLARILKVNNSTIRKMLKKEIRKLEIQTLD